MAWTAARRASLSAPRITISSASRNLAAKAAVPAVPPALPPWKPQASCALKSAPVRGVWSRTGRPAASVIGNTKLDPNT